MKEQFANLWDTILAYLLTVLGALLILVGFWLAALIVSALVRGALRRTQLDEKLVRIVAGDAGRKIESGPWIARVVFYLIMLFGVVAFFETLNLPQVNEPVNRLLGSVFEFAPRVLSAGALIVLAWVLARVVRSAMIRALEFSRFDEWVGAPAEGSVGVSRSIASTLYWLVFLLFLPMILDSLALEGLLEPINSMLERFLGFLPNLFAAGLILFFGWLVAKIVRQVVTNLLAAVGLDRLGQRAGVDTIVGRQGLSGILGTVVYVLILIPVAISALDTLELGAVSEPASTMLATILAAFPAVFTAALILFIAYTVGRFAAGLVADILGRVGFNSLPEKLGLGWKPSAEQRTAADMVGYLVLVATLFFASIEAADQLGLFALSRILVEFVEFGGQVLLGLIIFGFGLYLANLSVRLIESSARPERRLLATAARAAILVLTSAMALRQMGLGDRIIEYAFGGLIVAVSLALALAFGLGGRDAAARAVEGWRRRLEGGGGPPTDG